MGIIEEESKEGIKVIGDIGGIEPVLVFPSFRHPHEDVFLVGVAVELPFLNT